MNDRRLTIASPDDRRWTMDDSYRRLLSMAHRLSSVVYGPLVILLVASAGLHLFTLMRTPGVFVDEAWNANRAWALIHTGRAFVSLDSGVFEHYDGYWTFFPWLGTWLQSLSLRAFGPTLFAVRMASLVFGLVLLVAIYAIATRL